MAEPVTSLLRIRVINNQPPMYLTEGFENAGITTGTTLWHSLGTEAGTDNSINYWAQDAGSWTFASHLITAPYPGSAVYLRSGHSDWTDGTFLCRFKWVTGAFMSILMHYTATNSWIAASASGAQFLLQKNVVGTVTNVGTVTASLANGTFYWLLISGSGTSYTGAIYNDSSGAQGSLINNFTGTISDAALQSGYVALRNDLVANGQFGGAFANVCQFTGTAPAGATQDWQPVVTAGEPAFAWSTVNPQAGTHSASIQIIGSSSGNGSWQQATRLATGSNVSLSGQVRASAGAANVSAGGLTTTNAGASFGLVSASGAMTASPTLSCNYSGAVGTAYFDTLAVTNSAYEITNDLPHLHSAHIEVTAFQPGNPGSSALGNFAIPLHPPGSEGYAAAKPIYDKLDYFQRVECYISHDGAPLGKLYYAGIVTQIRRTYGDNPTFELSGHSDIVLANLSRPFLGELLSNDVTSAMLKSYLGTNEAGVSDNFNPFTAANYTSTNLPGFTPATWTGTTDDGFNVVSASTSTGGMLVSKTGAAANDRWHLQYVEITGRLSPSTDSTNAGNVYVGLSNSSANCNDCIVGKVTAKKLNGRYVLDALILVYAAGAFVSQALISNALSNVDDPQGMIPITLGLLIGLQGNATGTATGTLVVNGRAVIAQYPASQMDPGTTTRYPFVGFSLGTGAATCYLTNLVQLTRFATDGPSTSATFGNGTISTSAHSLPFGVDPGPTFLEAWSKFATREGWYWRYNPQAYVVGTRTLGTLDFAADPGTDRSKGAANANVIFSRSEGNLMSLGLTANGDSFASGTAVSSSPSPDGGGLGFFRDIASLQKYGVIDDQALAMATADFTTARRTAFQIISNKVNLSAAGSKTISVLRDPQTADVWRELDKVTIHDPEMGINYLTARVLGYTFDEGQPRQTLTLDQFSADDPSQIILIKRTQQANFEAAAALNRFGSADGAGPGFLGTIQAGSTFAALASSQAVSTANSGTFVDLTGSSFTLYVQRTSYFLYWIMVSGKITGGAGSGFIRGTIVNFDSSASIIQGGAATQTGFIWYYPFSLGPIQAGQYTVKMQAATDNGTTWTAAQMFHQIFLLGS